jgi:hypothetical protein
MLLSEFHSLSSIVSPAFRLTRYVTLESRSQKLAANDADHWSILHRNNLHERLLLLGLRADFAKLTRQVTIFSYLYNLVVNAPRILVVPRGRSAAQRDARLSRADCLLRSRDTPAGLSLQPAQAL